jgi:hypothetical protein
MASKKITIRPKDQGNIQLMFSKPKVTKVAAAPVAASVTVVAAPTVPVAAPIAVVAAVAAVSATTLKSTNPDVQAFYNSLSTPQRIAHELAIEKLGTSYDVTRTHGFLRYLATK